MTYHASEEDAIRNAGQGTDTAWQHDHGIRLIRAAGDVSTDIGIRLLMNFAGGVTE